MQLCNRCSVCRVEGENSIHVLFECKLSQIIWRKSFPKVMDLFFTTNLEELWQVIFYELQKDKSVELFCIIYWLIWSNRNRCFHDNLCHSPRKIINSVVRMNEEFIQLTREEPRLAGIQNVDWDPPL